MSDPYDFRPGGSLKLKRSGDEPEGHRKKKKKSSKPRDERKEDTSEVQADRIKDTDVPGGGPSGTSSGEIAKTEAELRFEEKQRQRRERKVKKLASMTHKDRVHEFNAKLESLSEHHDIPKVGPG